jgi:poly(3-hydroxybutyrate) depolymerase
MGVVLLALVALAGLAGCEPVVAGGVDDVRADAGRPALPRAAYLDEAAREHSATMCDQGAAIPSADPLAHYGGETAVAISELVASEPLDRSIHDGGQRNLDATNRIWARLAGRPELLEARWDEQGVGEVTCANGRLYVTVVLRDGPTMPGAGRFSAAVYRADQVTKQSGLVYGTAKDYQGRTIDLVLDLYLPPAGGPALRPTVVMVHGGSFSGGHRSDRALDATEFARRGFVAASIDYRLRPNDIGPEQLAAATDAIDDGIESVRWLKSHAAEYGIDVGRMAMDGTSAGGAIALGVALTDDPTPGGPLADVSPKIAAAVSTGAHLTPGLAGITLTADDAPIMMFHYEHDTSRLKSTFEDAYQTCTAVRRAGDVCDAIRLPGSGHTVSVGPQGKWWTPEIGPFLWAHLHLASVGATS